MKGPIEWKCQCDRPSRTLYRTKDRMKSNSSDTRPTSISTLSLGLFPNSKGKCHGHLVECLGRSSKERGEMFLPAELIKKKRNGHSHSKDEVDFLIKEYSEGRLPDYQMSAWLMAVYFNGLDRNELAFLTSSMLHSGSQLNFSDLSKTIVDKHSTGGVGDKTSLILGPIVAASGLVVPMISGRGLGHTGGTLDKLESIPGFSTQIPLDRYHSLIRKHNLIYIGQTQEICPADKKIYALRDVTATVESIPLICASIMSKKLAEGLDALVLDVKWGSGAFMKTIEDAETMAQKLCEIGWAQNKRVAALITDMNQPLGRFAGNSLEIRESVEILQGSLQYPDTRELSLQLSAHMLHLGKATATLRDGYQLATKLLESGQAFEKFAQICRAQGGRLDELPTSKQKFDVTAPRSGCVASFNAEKLGVASILLGAGRKATTDVIDPASGIEFHRKIGSQVSTGEPLFTCHSQRLSSRDQVTQMLLDSVAISDGQVNSPTLILKVMESQI